MYKRGQENLTPIIYAAIAISILLISAGGVYYFYKTTRQADDAELLVLVSRLSKALETDSSQYGAVEAVSFSMPNGAEEMCIVDRTRPYNELTNNMLSSIIDIYSDFNVFIKYNGEFRPYRIEGLRLEQQDNPFCMKAKNRKIDLALENKGEFKDIASSAEKAPNDCTSIVYNGDPMQKLDIVFIASSYNDIDEFKTDSEAFVDMMRTNEPFKTAFGKLNFHIVEDVASIKCSVDSLIRCSESAVSGLAAQCPNDIVVVMHREGLLGKGRSSSVRNLIKISTRYRPAVLLHELGHVVADLADEYVDNDYYSKIPNFNAALYPNCDTAGCGKWALLAECYQGCSLGNYYRPTESSIMRDLNDKSYGPVNEKELLYNMRQYR